MITSQNYQNRLRTCRLKNTHTNTYISEFYFGVRVSELFTATKQVVICLATDFIKYECILYINDVCKILRKCFSSKP